MQRSNPPRPNKHLLPYDVYERHRMIGSLTRDGQTVLDVGGELDHLSQFCHPAKLIVANLEKGDVIISPDKLPFAKNSFDVVCAIDVLEHIPKLKRPQFVKRLAAVAKKLAILSFPIGTKNHRAYEAKLQRWLTKKGLKVSYLEEHTRYGLPTPQEIASLTKNLGNLRTRIFYSGNLAVNQFLFKLFLFDPKIKYLRKIIYWLKLAFNFLTNPILYVLLSPKSHSQSVNRAYLIITKEKK